jgi:mono/diheme cytochrome c family protein
MQHFTRLTSASTVAIAAALAAPAQAQSLGQRTPGAEGQQVYKRANCVGCHKWHGDGGGGYGGAALSLRRTELDREQIIEAIRCGRPATGMPYHQRDAYEGDARSCFDTTRAELGPQMPPAAVAFLRPSEVEAVADYVLAEIKGKGDVTLAECTRFFGQGTRMCHSFEAGAQPLRPAGAAADGRGH